MTLFHQQAKPSKEHFLNIPSNFKSGPAEFATKEAKGKIRDIGRWVLSEEVNSCISYINACKGSISKAVKQKLQQHRDMEKTF